MAEGYHWAPNYEKNRWFLVIKLRKPPDDDLNRLLRACNSVAEAFGQSVLYEDSTPPNNTAFDRKRQRQSASSSFQARVSVAQSKVCQDLSDHFHISIGWTLEPPPPASLETLSAILEGGLVESLDIPIQVVKVKLGNSVIAMGLATKNVEANGIIGI